MLTFHQAFTAVLTGQDNKKHLPFLVQVPMGTRRLAIRLTYPRPARSGISNLLTLTVLDPDGFRGAAHRGVEDLDIVIQENVASPGFLPGRLPPGEWTILVDTHLILAEAPVLVELVVTGSDQTDPGLTLVPGGNEPVARPEQEIDEKHKPMRAGRSGKSGSPGWYRGDFHTHTYHSDGHWTVAELVAFAPQQGLDFITLSDHNTVSGLAELEGACPPGLLPIYASELTTFWGHALALGRREWVDWRIRPERGMPEIAAEIEAQGGLFVIAHPEAVGDPYCTGCHWAFPEVSPGSARVVEVWNSPWVSESFNEAGLQLVYQWMNQGLRMVLTAGTDCHGPEHRDPDGRVGDFLAPGHGFNLVFAEELSQAAILQGVRAGHVVLTSGPSLSLSGQLAGQSLMPGDCCLAQAGETVRLEVVWGDCPADSKLELVVDGNVRETVVGGSFATWELPGEQTGWALAALRKPDGEMLALTNPIYFNGQLASR